MPGHTRLARRIQRKRTPEESPSRPRPSAHPQSTHAAVLQLQRSVGNQAVSRFIQRLPSAETVRQRLGKPKRSFRIGHGSKKYKAVLAALQAYQNYLTNTKLDKYSYVAQFQHALRLLGYVQQAAALYTGRKGKKADYFINQLLPGIAREKSYIANTALSLATQGMPKSIFGENLASTMLTRGGPSKMKEINESQVSGSDKGGTSEVTKFNIGGSTSYFKQNKEKLAYFATYEEEEAKQNELTEQYGPDKAGEIITGLSNESELGVKMVGIAHDDARMANRDVAMSRLNQLLGQDVIARSELVIRNMPNGQQVMGSLMEGAKGTSAGKLMKGGKIYDKPEEKSGAGPGALSSKDPNLMRLLSKLQYIDLLAFQVDRNPANYYIQQDSQGNVIGITGIDNDLSLGTSTDVEGNNQELPGLSRYVDAEIAQKIINVDLNLVRLIMVDLLSEPEIEALIKRFKKVQDHLRDKKTRLLKPNEWDDAVAKGLLDEQKSYYSAFHFHKGWKFAPPKT